MPNPPYQVLQLLPGIQHSLVNTSLSGAPGLSSQCLLRGQAHVCDLFLCTHSKYSMDNNGWHSGTAGWCGEGNQVISVTQPAAYAAAA